MRSLAAGNVLINVGWNASFAFLPLIVKSMGVERNLELWVGVMMFGYYGVSCVFTPVWGVLADYYGRKSMILRAGFGMATGFTLLAMTSDPIAFTLVLVVTGLANGYVPAGQALIATTTPRREVGGALALTQAGASTGTLVGPMVGAALVGLLPSMHSLFSFTGVAMYIAGFLALFLVREHHVRPSHPLRIDLRGDIAHLWHVPQLKLLYFIQVLFAFTVFGAVAIVTLFTLELLARQPGYGGIGVESWVAMMAMGFTLASIAVLPFWGRMLNRYPTARVLSIILAGTLATSVLLPLVRNPLDLLIARILFALFVSGLPPTLIRMIRDRAPKGMEARTLSYGTAIQQIGSATAPLVAGLLAPYLGLRGYFALASGLIGVGWALWRKAEREGRTGTHH
ncbi:MAG: MFS transporter [Betaproteobacteria bacterium]|nr:MAG: MFS transporter [Betaproteobacteria bacterium]